MNPSEERVVNHDFTRRAHPDTEIRITGGYHVALRIKPAQTVEHRATAGEKGAGYGAYFVRQQSAIQVAAVIRRITHRLVSRRAVLAKSNAGVLYGAVRIEEPSADHTDLVPRQLAAHPDIPAIGQADHIVIQKYQ